VNRVLYIKASPRANSKSHELAEIYLASLREKHPGVIIDLLDLAVERLPEFDGDKVAAKMATITGESHTGAVKSAWDEIIEIAKRFTAADEYVLSVPMWNGGIPYRLKHYIDLIHQPGLLWTLDPQKGYQGLLQGKKAVLTLTSGAWGPEMPSPAFGIDHHSTYLRAWLNQAGVTDISEIRFQPTLLNPDPEQSFRAAAETAKDVSAAR